MGRSGFKTPFRSNFCLGAKFPILKLIIYFLICTHGWITGCEQKPEAVKPVPPNKAPAELVQGTIVALGDSLTAGLGVDESQAYPALIQKKLANDGHGYKVINAGISGETSSGTLSRIDWVTASLKPDIVILVTGANDGMRGIDPNHLRKNLDRIITFLEKKNIRVIVGGMKMLPNLGPDYSKEFERIYPELADTHDVPLIPFFLKGVAGEKKLNQPDGIHPTAEGYKMIVDHIYPYVLEEVKKR